MYLYHNTRSVSYIQLELLNQQHHSPAGKLVSLMQHKKLNTKFRNSKRTVSSKLQIKVYVYSNNNSWDLIKLLFSVCFNVFSSHLSISDCQCYLTLHNGLCFTVQTIAFWNLLATLNSRIKSNNGFHLLLDLWYLSFT